MKKIFAFALAMLTVSLFAWGPGHDDHADLVMQNLPEDVRYFFQQNGVKDLKKWCHFPDGGGKLSEMKQLQFLPKEDLAFLDAAGIGQYQFHTSQGKAASFYLLARSFRNMDAQAAQFYAGCLLHSVADAAAFNHGPLIHTYTYTQYKHIQYPIRKEYMDLACMRKEPVLRQMIQDRLKDFKPEIPRGLFNDLMMKILLSDSEAADIMCAWEHKLVLPPPQCFEAMAVIADYQTRTGVNNIAAAWSMTMSDELLEVPKEDFMKNGRIATAYKTEQAKRPPRDPALDGVYDGLFGRTVHYPAAGIVCEGSAAMNHADMGFGARFLAACTARSLIRDGREVQMISVKDMAKSSFDPQKLPVMIFCGMIPPYAQKTVLAYQKAGGKLILVGGPCPDKKLAGFPQSAYVKHSNDEIPATATYGKANENVWQNMKVISADGKTYPMNDNPNTPAGWNKPTCIYSIALSDGMTPLWSLNNGKETFCIAAADKNMLWLPAYLLMPFLFSRDTGMSDWAHPTLDSFGSAIMIDAVNRFMPKK